MEVMVVIALILMITAALAYGLTGMFVRAQDDVDGMKLGRVAQMLDAERMQRGKLPDRLEDARITPPTDHAGHPAVYRRQGDGFDLRFPGEDGHVGTADDVVFTPDA